MPTYQYRCVDCGAPIEAVQKFTDDALTECPNCGGTLRKVFSAVGVVFKGSGFYATDSRAKGEPSSTAAKESGAAKQSGAGESTGSGDSAKPAATKDSSSSTKSASSGAPAA
ncbi:FmdB family zinc ribbon protein [Micropruina sonneratiae]|uniref:FmdB family zinc ribbon protein n=1 Tax=Micropruina sonneratiae TaxID=2986940 RepID=UPI0029D40F4F|nr:FmdB family zinc ribbon protein [Micropruina sp. KQZ13P-5]